MGTQYFEGCGVFIKSINHKTQGSKTIQGNPYYFGWSTPFLIVLLTLGRPHVMGVMTRCRFWCSTLGYRSFGKAFYDMQRKASGCHTQDSSTQQREEDVSQALKNVS